MDQVKTPVQYEFRNPYALPGATSAASAAQALREEVIVAYAPRPAPRSMRLFAALIDVLLYALACAPWMFGLALYAPDVSPTSMRASLALVSVVALISLSVCNVVQLHRQGQTLGKAWLGVRVVRGDGAEARLPRLLLRQAPVALYLLPWIGPALALLDLAGALGPSRRGWRDRLTDTRVTTF